MLGIGGGAECRDLSRFAPLHVTEPERAIYRIYRDIAVQQRQETLQDPHRGIFSAPRHGPNTASGYYVGVSHKEVA